MIKTLSKSIREYKKDSILTALLVSLEVVLEVVIPLLMSRLIDYGIDLGNMSVVIQMGIALLICAVLSLFFGALAGEKAARASSGFARNLRRDMFANVQTFAFSNIDKFSTASIVTRLTTDVSRIQMAYQMLIRMAIRSPIMMVFTLVAAFNIDAHLAMVFFASMPILAVGLYLIMSHAHPTFRRVFKAYDRLNQIIQENVRGIRVVKSFVREEHEIEKFQGASDWIYRDFSKAGKLVALNGPLMQFCMYGTTLLISWLGARSIVSTGGDPRLGLSTGELMTMIAYAAQVLMSLMAMSMLFLMITISRASAERIQEILLEKSDLNDPDSPVTEVADGSVDFSDVTFSYGRDADQPALQHIELHIKSGETIGILGSTGSSKSTLVQLIPRLYDATQGQVKVGGRDVKEYSLHALRDQVSMVLQKNELFSGTIAENLRWGNKDATDEELREACRMAQADSFIQDFPDGYETHIEQGGTNVSGGQKQRLCIARALLKKPKILILDDSTSAVDTRTDALIRQGFREFIPDTTKIIIAQRIASVQDADMIVVLDNGTVSDVGTHEELLGRSEIYREVYEQQTNGGDE